MLNLHKSEDLIEAMVIVTCGEASSAQARHLYRETLRSLVRLVKAEHSAELQFSSCLNAPAYQHCKPH